MTVSSIPMFSFSIFLTKSSIVGMVCLKLEFLSSNVYIFKNLAPLICLSLKFKKTWSVLSSWLEQSKQMISPPVLFSPSSKFYNSSVEMNTGSPYITCFTYFSGLLPLALFFPPFSNLLLLKPPSPSASFWLQQPIC